MNRIRSYRFALMLGISIWGTAGCTNDPDASEARPEEKESCTLKVSACNNDCHKADALKECPRCCFMNGRLCDRGEDYAFYACQNLD
ncbi:MAG: hypothetical protein IPM54_37060 [Polyangiaceae bacterium]|nr:hypothetical protein [Polyangiaceae bacterium]